MKSGTLLGEIRCRGKMSSRFLPRGLAAAILLAAGCQSTAPLGLEPSRGKFGAHPKPEMNCTAAPSGWRVPAAALAAVPVIECGGGGPGSDSFTARRDTIDAWFKREAYRAGCFGGCLATMFARNPYTAPVCAWCAADGIRYVAQGIWNWQTSSGKSWSFTPSYDEFWARSDVRRATEQWTAYCSSGNGTC